MMDFETREAIMESMRTDVFKEVIRLYKFLEKIGFDITKPMPLDKIEHVYTVNKLFRVYQARQHFLKAKAQFERLLDNEKRRVKQIELDQIVKKMNKFPKWLRSRWYKSKFIRIMNELEVLERKINGIMNELEVLERKINDGYVGGWEINDNISSLILRDIQYMMNEPQHIVIDEDLSISGRGKRVEEEKFKGSDQ